MARLNMIGVTGCSGRIGNVIIYQIGSKLYARSASLTVRNPKTPLQEANRKKFAELNRLAGVFAHAVCVCFSRLTPVKYKRMFVRLNKEVVRVMPDAAPEVEWWRLRLSHGVLIEPHVEVEETDGELCFSKTLQEYGEDCRAEDMVYAVVVDVEHLVAILVPLGMRRYAGRVEWALPGEMRGTERFVYVFAVARDGVTVSSSRCTYFCRKG